jgi:hypothetical protein
MAVLAAPIWRCPVGLGANLTLTIFLIGNIAQYQSLREDKNGGNASYYSPFKGVFTINSN